MSDDNPIVSQMSGKKKVVFGVAAGIACAVSTILSNIYKDEGGYVNNRHDPGGETNYGVTKRTAQANGWKETMKSFPKQCESYQSVCADRIYYEQFMEKPGFVPLIKIDPVVSEELVNTAVNMGTVKPSKWLQQSLMETCPALADDFGITADGKVGPKTVAYFGECRKQVGPMLFCVKLLDALDGKQRNEYTRIVTAKPSQRVFYRGWISHRIGNVDRKKCAPGNT